MLIWRSLFFGVSGQHLLEVEKVLFGEAYNDFLVAELNANRQWLRTAFAREFQRA